MRVMSVLCVLALLALATVATSAATAQQPSPVAAQAPSPSAAALVNLNTATQAQLEALPGVGPKTAARILDYRQKNGSFKKVEELMNVRGVGEKSFLRIKNQLTVGAPKANHP